MLLKARPSGCIRGLCAFNADFDGDQSGPRSAVGEAQVEARVRLMRSITFSRPPTASRLRLPSQDMVLGCYWLTKERAGCKGEGKVFGSPEEVRIAFDSRELEVHARIRVRIEGNLVQTTVGRVILSDVLPPGLPFANANKLMTKKEMTKLITPSIVRAATVRPYVLDKVKDTGFEYATRAGISIASTHAYSDQEARIVGKAQHESRRSNGSMRGVDHQRRTL